MILPIWFFWMLTNRLIHQNSRNSGACPIFGSEKSLPSLLRSPALELPGQAMTTCPWAKWSLGEELRKCQHLGHIKSCFITRKMVIYKNLSDIRYPIFFLPRMWFLFVVFRTLDTMLDGLCSYHLGLLYLWNKNKFVTCPTKIQNAGSAFLNLTVGIHILMVAPLFCFNPCSLWLVSMKPTQGQAAWPLSPRPGPLDVSENGCCFPAKNKFSMLYFKDL